MALHTTEEDQVIDIMHRDQACDLEDLARRCPNLTWNQVFLAVDHLSRTGEVTLVLAKGGGYIVALPRAGREVGQINIRGHPNHEEVRRARGCTCVPRNRRLTTTLDSAR